MKTKPDINTMPVINDPANADTGIRTYRLSATMAQLQASERQHRAIFESTGDFAIVATDRDGNVTDWNSGAEHILGWTAEEMRGQTVEQFFTPEDRARNRAAIEMTLALQDGRASDERWHLRKDGERFWASGEMMPLRDDEGEHIGFVKVLRDRTAEHRAGIALQEAQEQLKRAQEAGGAGLFWVSIDDNVLHPTEEFCRLFGVEPCETCSPKAFEDAAVPDDRDRPSTEQSRRAGAAVPSIEYRIRRVDTGEVRWIARKGKTDFDDQGRAVRFSGVAQDITERKLAETALKQTQERLELALDAADLGLWSLDLATDQSVRSQRHDEMFGYAEPQSEWGHERALRHVVEEDKHKFEQAFTDAYATGAFAAKVRVRWPDGSIHWIAPQGRVHYDKAGQPVSIMGVVADITERKRDEQELIDLATNLETRVEERTRELGLAEEALRQSQKMEAVGQLTGGLAHDFNNLLAVITGSLELLQMRIAKGRISDIDRFITASQTAAKRASSLTHRLLAFSRRQTLDPQDTNVGSLIGGVVDMIRRTVGPEIPVDIAIADDVWTTLVDPNQLENALLNLCINARDAMPDGGRITIEANNKVLDDKTARTRDMQPGEYVAVSVSDTGTGMPPEMIARVFEPFFTTKPIGQGTGLGLSMIYGFTRQSGGQVRIHSGVGEGATVTMFLPRSEGIVEAGHTAETSAPSRAENGQTVLVVDDEQSIRMLIVDVLEELGYSAIEAHDGQAGLKVLQSDMRVDLLVTDVGMPGMNGRQLADAGRVLRPDLKVLFVTGYAETAVVNHGHLEAGMAIVTKPFVMEALASRIEELISGSPSSHHSRESRA